MTRRRSVTTAGSLLLSGLALAACGSSSSSSLTPSQATTLANQINLTSADVPGYSSSPNAESAADKQSGAQLAACAGGVPPSKNIADVNSPNFSAGSGLTQMQTSSNVVVLPSSALVQQNLKALTSAKGHACLNTFVSNELSKSTSAGVTFNSGTITSLPTSTAGTDGGFGIRFIISAAAQGVHIPFYLDVLGFAKNSTEVELEALGISKPFPAAEESHLYSLLVSRADAHVPAS